MPKQHPVRLLPTLGIIAQELRELGIRAECPAADPHTFYRGVRRFRGQRPQRDILYILTADEAAAFPVDTCAYLSPDPISGSADHIHCPGATADGLLEVLLDLFLDFQEQESRINNLILEGASLEQLCQLGEELLGNAVIIHDGWFLVLARSKSSAAFMPDTPSPWELIPQQFLDEFRMDVEYQKTYLHRRAELWDSIVEGRHLHTMYVNIYEEETYRGRLLVTDETRPFKGRDYLIAELLAQQALVLLKAKRGGADSGNRGADDILFDVLNGKYVAAAELSALLQTLRWEKNDRFLCVRVQRQEPMKADAVDHILHKELFLSFPESYIMFTAGQQCILINLRKTPLSPSEVRHKLAPLCRDFYQYGGISSPVEGIRELPVAYHQAEEALSQAFRLHDDHWIIHFYSCALNYILTHLNTSMQLRHLVAPQLLALRQYDAEKGSQYFETFKAYLDNERDIPKTAAALIIHRTTLTYRLRKIQAMLDMNLEDPKVRLYLQLSLRMLEQEKTVKLSEVIETP